MDKLEDAMRKVTFSDEEEIPPPFKDHALRGDLQGSRELHIDRDWLLVYTTNGEAVVFERTGKHDEVF